MNLEVKKKNRPVQIIRLSRRYCVLRQFYGIINGRGRVVRQTLESYFLFGHKFAWNMYTINVDMFCAMIIDTSWRYVQALSYIWVLWIPRPQNMAKASNVATSQSVNGNPVSWNSIFTQLYWFRILFFDTWLNTKKNKWVLKSELKIKFGLNIFSFLTWRRSIV